MKSNEIFIAGKKVFCLGIGGIGLSAAAQWLKATGVTVSGSDQSESSITELLRRKQIDVIIEKANGAIPPDTDFLVYSDAIPENNPGRLFAKEKGIKQYSYAEALGILSAPYKCVAVAGSHGKSTTSALVAHIFNFAEIDPTAVIGTKVPCFGNTNFRLGQSDTLVVEADEYRNHFLQLNPFVGIITNVDHDHVDAFPTEQSYVRAFINFVKKIKNNGILVMKSGDKYTNELTKQAAHLKINYFNLAGKADINRNHENETTSYLIVNNTYQGGFQKFNIERNGKSLGNFETSLPGDHILLNIAAAVAAVEPWMISPEKLKSAIKSFLGTWRRFEYVGNFKGSVVISDYSHHPTEIRAMLQGARQAYADKKILVVFQPHHGARTRHFAGEFVDALSLADEIIILEVYGVAGRENKEEQISTKSWAEQLARLGKKALFANDLEEAHDILGKISLQGVVIIATGAGNVDKLARKLTDTA